MEYAEQYSKNTIVEKRNLCNRILERWGARADVNTVTPKMGLDYLKEQKASRSANCANRDRKNLLSMWNWGMQYLEIKKNPFAQIKRFAHDRAPQYVPPRGDVLKVIAACNAQDWAYLDTFLQTGARRSEVNRLTVADVDLERRKIRLTNRKSRDGSLQERLLDMSNELHDTLERWLRIRPIKDTEWLFYVLDERSEHYGKPFTTRRRFLKGMCSRAGVREFGFHALRRHVASILAVKGVPAKVIQSILGHASLATTERYIYNLMNDQAKIMELLSTSLESQDGDQKKSS
jgi:integrase